MSVDATKVRTVAVVGHAASGKTSLVDALLYLAKAVPTRGSTAKGNSAADNLPEEIERKITIHAKPFWFESGGCRVTVLDTPGFADFLGQTVAAIRAADAAIVVVDAVNGVEVGTRRIWQWLEAEQKPRLIFVSKLDKENADFAKTVGQIQSVLGKKCVPFVVPVGKEAGFQKVVNLLTAAEADVPAEFAGAQDALQEAAAADDEKLIEKFFNGDKLTPQEIAGSVAKGAVVPILCGLADRDLGVPEVLSAITGLLPSPVARGPVAAAGDVKIEPNADAPVCALVFKVTVDPYAGALAYCRVVAGTLKPDLDVINSTRGGKERIPQLLRIVGKNQTIVAEAGPGEIVALAKLKDTHINDTLCDPARPVKLPPIQFPKPVAFAAVHPHTQKDEEKISTALHRTEAEDKTFHAERNPNTHELVIAGMGDTHLAVIVQGWKQRLGVNVDLSVPKVDYKETITGRAEGHYKHKKQSGGRGQYGEAYLRLAPLERGAGFRFVDEVVGGAIPRNFIPAVEKGCQEALLAGVVAGYPVVDVQATVYDGSYHDVDSNELSFKIAGLQAFKDAMAKARPILLEPIMKVTVFVPDQYMGDVTGDLNHRRGRIMGVEPADGLQCIIAQVPQAEIFKYANELRSMTGGRGSFELEFSHYEQVPANVAQKVIAEAQAAKKAQQEG
jgi:elongation factor G